MNKILFTLSILVGSFGFSQTKLIAHKSHSGNSENFRKAINNNLFDSDNSNLGDAGMRIYAEDYQVVDSVVYLSKNKVIRFSSEYTQRKFRKTKEKCSADERTRTFRDTLIITPKSIRNGLTLQDVQKRIDSLKINNQQTVNTIYKGFDKRSKSKKSKKSIISFFVDFPNFSNNFFVINVLSVLSIVVYRISKKSAYKKTVISH